LLCGPQAPIIAAVIGRSFQDPDAGKDCGQEEKGMKEDELVG